MEFKLKFFNVKKVKMNSQIFKGENSKFDSFILNIIDYHTSRCDPTTRVPGSIDFCL